ncbi:auxilin-related protein 1-like isoform X2 [Salvia hispanica]|uniref:auxilin-related protein 1-like isoform X2 n=1 Tax=Salvia hispanica TaxID=49212 RepID=UPI002009429E|nr:auxilin-related protein 1-like isoform X2 [Salvia hispanica]
MDDSWRTRIGMPAPPSPPPILHHLHRESTADAEEFSDVFGGPPRTILSRQFSPAFPRSSSSSSSSTGCFYEEIFPPPEKSAPPPPGRSLPEFRIPSYQKREENGFYRDIFGWEDERAARSRSRSKASSSSVLSSEELSPHRPSDVASFASKLRPINVRSRWNSTSIGHEDQNMMPPFSSSHGSNRVSADDMELNNSPASAVSSVCHSSLGRDEDDVLRADEVEEEDEVMSSYVIEISSENREGTCESNGVDEAIAWAKEKSQTHYSECEAEKTTHDVLNGHQVSEGHTDSFGSLDKQRVKWEIVEEEQQLEHMDKQQVNWEIVEEEQQLEYMEHTETDVLDEKIRLWSSGKEADIRLLLSSLHHILWPNSGWSPVPLANIIEATQVKKTYQRAQLCLHPDKLQQRGATPQQKYIADKAFSILQDAWDAFISLDVF